MSRLLDKFNGSRESKALTVSSPFTEQQRVAIQENGRRSRTLTPSHVRVFSISADISGPWSQWGEATNGRGIAVQRAVKDAIEAALPQGWKAVVAVKHG